MCECHCRQDRKKTIKGLKKLERAIRELSEEARELTREGHPSVRNDILTSLEKARSSVLWIRVRLSGEVRD